MRKHPMYSLPAFVLSLGLVAATPVYADHKSGYKHCVIDKIDKMKTELGITPAQDKQLKMIREKAHKFMESKRGEVRSIHKEANELADAKDIDMKKLDMLAEKAGKLQIGRAHV